MAMTKVKREIAPVNGMDFMDVMSFTTENYIGIWDERSTCFMLIQKTKKGFCPDLVDTQNVCRTLQELDDEVYSICEEHILTVSDKSTYIFSVIDEN